MRGTTTITPTGVERSIGPDELLVSKTDPKGILTYVNPVFCRMAVASEGDLLGRPHNIIRHPDMPRAIFKLLWDSITARREIFAYVKNLGMDGSHYWVFAHVTASVTPQGAVAGYHSNRRRPSPEAIKAVQPLYSRLREIERAQSTRDGLDASMAALHGTLEERGMTYDEFVWSITP